MINPHLKCCTLIVTFCVICQHPRPRHCFATQLGQVYTNTDIWEKNTKKNTYIFICALTFCPHANALWGQWVDYLFGGENFPKPIFFYYFFLEFALQKKPTTTELFLGWTSVPAWPYKLGHIVPPAVWAWGRRPTDGWTARCFGNILTLELWNLIV